MLHKLKLADRAAKSLALIGIFRGSIQAGLRKTDRARRHGEAAPVEGRHRDREALAFLPDKVLFRHAHVLHDNFARVACAHSQFAVYSACRETFHASFKDKRGHAVRDKDAVASCAMIAELTAYAKDNGKSLFDFLTEMYMENGFYYEGLISLTKKGKAGAEEIQQMMVNLRNNIPSTVAGSEPVTVLDYNNLTSKNLKTGVVTIIPEGLGMEKSNVIQLVLADGTKVSARPSGTEPKIKFYVSVNAPLTRPEDFENVLSSLKSKVSDIQEDLGLK